MATIYSGQIDFIIAERIGVLTADLGFTNRGCQERFEELFYIRDRIKELLDEHRNELPRP